MFTHATTSPPDSSVWRAYTDTFKTASTTEGLFAALGIANVPESEDFKYEIEEFFADNQTSFSYRRRSTPGAGGSVAYEGTGLQVNPANISENDACAFYVDGSTFAFADDMGGTYGDPRMWWGPESEDEEAVNVTFSGLAAAVESASFRVNDTLDEGIQQLEDVDPDDPDTTNILRSLHLCQSHPIVGAPNVMPARTEASTSSPGCTLTSMASPFDVALWLLESGMKIDAEVMDKMWLPMTLSRFDAHYYEDGIAPSAAVVLWDPEASQGQMLVSSQLSGADDEGLNTEDTWYQLSKGGNGESSLGVVGSENLGVSPAVQREMVDRAVRMNAQSETE